jgi:hypothetical protein
MAKDLTESPVDRQNILNNSYAIAEIQHATKIKGIRFEGTVCLIKEQVAAFFEVDVRTIERYLEKYGEELGKNGYEVLRENRLKSFKMSVKEQFVTSTNGTKIFCTPGLTRKIIEKISRMPFAITWTWAISNIRSTRIKST